MTVTRSNIEDWFNGAPVGTTHMFVVTDTYDHGNFPIYVAVTAPNVATLVPGNMQKIEECYALHLPLKDQLDEHRAWHVEAPPAREVPSSGPLDNLSAVERLAAIAAVKKVREEQEAIQARFEALEIQLHWSNILNSEHAGIDLDIKGFRETAEVLGYPLYAWNGHIYGTDSASIGEDNCIALVDDLP